MTGALLLPILLVAGLAQPAAGPFASPKPFSRLFKKANSPTEAARVALQQKVAEAANPPRVVCGMRVYRANPDVDRSSVRRVPGQTSGMAIRRIPPRVCAD